MRILLLTNDRNTTGGSGRNAANMTAALRAAGHEVRALGYKKNLIGFTWRAWREARISDVVQAIDVNPMGYAGYAAMRLSRAKLVIVAQAAYSVAPLYHRKTAIVSKIAYSAAAGVVAGSEYVAKEIQKVLPKLAITVIDPGIDLSKFPANRVRSRESASAPYLLSVGGVKSRKGHHQSLRAFALSKKAIPELRYIIVGSLEQQPGYVRDLKELVRELGVEKDVDFLPNVSDAQLNELYDNAALFILTSINDGHHFEGFGMVFLEAAAHGVPSIGTTDNGIAGAVEDEKTGLLVPQNDPQATAEAIKKILLDPVLGASMRERAYAFAREHDIEHLTRCYQRLYDAIFTSR